MTTGTESSLFCFHNLLGICRTALMVAAAEGELSVVKYLLARTAADRNATDRWGRTALDDATEVISFFLCCCGS